MGVYIGGTKVAGLEKELPAQAGNAGKYLYTDGENASWQEAATTQIWIGTQAEYDALGVYDPEVVYEITDDCANLEPIQHSVTERNIGEIVYSTVPITDPCVHLADGDLLDGTGIYKDFYEYMVSVYNAGHTSIFTTEEDWQNQYTNNNHICGKYVLNTTNHTIRLPSIWGWLEGVRDELKAGTYLPPGLPNITGMFYGQNAALTSGSGAFATGSNLYGGTVSAGSTNNQMTFDASRSSSVYGTQTTDVVQPRGVQVLIYIVIANTVKTPVEVDIDNIATELNACYGHRVIAFQAPTAQNNYTWYRKYADGWVEQGGRCYSTASITLPVVMADTNYNIQITGVGMSINNLVTIFGYENITKYGFDFVGLTIQSNGTIGASTSNNRAWEVKGMAA